jgi:hypothetical protein
LSLFLARYLSPLLMLDWNILHIESIVKPAHVPFRTIEIDRENN